MYTKIFIGVAFVVVAVLLTLFVIWLTAGSMWAIISCILLLLLAGVFIAKGTGIIVLASETSMLFGAAMVLFTIIIIWMTVVAFWQSSKERAKLDAKNMANPTLCKDDDSGDWVKIPGGHYKYNDGSCVEGAPPATNVAQEKTEEALVLVKKCTTPCSAPLGAWKFKVRTDGNGLKIKFPGIPDWVDHPAEGTTNSPAGVKTGDVEFVSSNDKKPNVEVWLYRKINVPSQQ